MFEIPESVNFVIKNLNKNGYEAYLAGGCVRDFLMNKKPADYDIATSAEPFEVKKCFSECKLIETGIKHGTVTVVVSGFSIEITTYRIDGEYKDGRHPDAVSFSKNLADDLKRRDFTVNAMAYHPKTGLVDLYMGKEHINKKIISAVGEADKRFNEDALRILRALRFASVFGFSIERKTGESIIKNRELLLKISAERVFAELKKLLSGENAERIVLEYRSVFELIIPDFKNLSDDCYSNMAYKLSHTDSDILLRLCVFFSPLDAKKAEYALKSLKADNKTIAFVKKTLNGLEYDFKENKPSVKRFLRDNSEEILNAVIKIRSIAENNKMRKIKDISHEILKNNECFNLSALAVNGRDLSEHFSISGKKVGETLGFLLELVTDEKVRNDKNELLKIVELREKTENSEKK